MSDADTPHDAPFDLDKLLALIELMEKHGLTEICLKRGGEKWKVRRGPEPGTYLPASAPVAAPFPVAASAADAKGMAEQEGTVTINSPTVGTFYASPTPDDPPFVAAGSRVEPETVVCIVEAMKVFNQIPAEVSGTIVAVLVKNGDSVEFGQPLYRVRPG
jgi:acetyl-CoA carboxylase biotin carboxyl carrier protein